MTKFRNDGHDLDRMVAASLKRGRKRLKRLLSGAIDRADND